MGKVRVLESWLAGRIAAGEVVERPASVVKELVENSLDAGARSVEVEIERGGFDLIRVRDDGEGMDREDALLALRRFATSKVTSPEDLNRIITLGFRGEALPSIAAVSHLELVTSTGDGEGTRVRAEGGEVVSSEPVGAPRGTTVTVRRLFYNTPARRKFLRSAAREAALCLEVVEKFAAAWPEVRFRVLRDGKEVLTLPPAPPRERAARVLGVRPDQLVEVTLEDGRVTIAGFVGTPETALPSRRGQHFSINRRPVRSSLLSRALEEGTRTLIFTGHYPVCALSLHLPPELVDPNVHPRKLEVRFADEQGLFGKVMQAVSDALRSRPLIRTAPHGPVIPSTARHEVGSQISLKGAEPASGILTPEPSQVATPSHEILTSRLPPLRVLGQVANTYIVAASPDGLVLVDQHAAHERVLFERLWKLRGKEEYVQILLVPVLLELPPAEAEVAERMKDVLQDAGFTLGGFGEGTCILRSVPSIAARAPLVSLVRACLAELASADSMQSPTELTMRLAGIAACHSAVRAGDPLTVEEMAALLRDLGACEDPYTCFHGRPTLVVADANTLENWFLRS
jgi:DNA mismatch repair protein MutL